MSIDTTAPRSRRALLAAGLGGAGAWLASTLLRPDGVSAANGDPLVLGQSNASSAATSLDLNASATGIQVQNAAPDGVALAGIGGGRGVIGTSTASGGYGILGQASHSIGVGVRGENITQAETPGTGVLGLSGPSSAALSNIPNTTGVFGTTTSDGVDAGVGVAGAGGTAGVSGYSYSGEGIHGRSQTLRGIVGIAGAEPATLPSKLGLYGYCAIDSLSIGVYGRSPAGVGAFGVTSSGRGLSGGATSGTGTQGQSETGSGIRGVSNSGTGVLASSTSGHAISASTTSTTVPAVVAQSTGATPYEGVLGKSGAGALPVPVSDIGLRGVANRVDGSIGVSGETANGTGLYGVGYYGAYANGWIGVVGDVDGGVGVQGWSGVAVAPDPGAKTGVWAGAENTRTALQVSGIARFSRSGRASVAANTSSIAVTVPGGLTSGSYAIATPNTNRTGVFVQSVVPSATTGKITIYLNKVASSTASTSIAWMVIG